MTKEITKAIILQEMGDKLQLREFASSKFLFDETVIPTYNIEQHLEEWWLRYVTQSITGTGEQIFYSIPEDVRWHLKRYDVVFMTGAFSIAGVYIKRKNAVPADAFVYLDLKAAQNASYHVETDVVLNRGDHIYVNVDGYTSPGDLRIYFDAKVETLR